MHSFVVAFISFEGFLFGASAEVPNQATKCAKCQDEVYHASGHSLLQRAVINGSTLWETVTCTDELSKTCETCHKKTRGILCTECKKGYWSPVGGDLMECRSCEGGDSSELSV